MTASLHTTLQVLLVIGLAAPAYTYFAYPVLLLLVAAGRQLRSDVALAQFGRLGSGGVFGLERDRDETKIGRPLVVVEAPVQQRADFVRVRRLHHHHARN